MFVSLGEEGCMSGILIILMSNCLFMYSIFPSFSLISLCLYFSAFIVFIFSHSYVLVMNFQNTNFVPCFSNFCT